MQLRKNDFPDEYVSDFEKFNEELPSQEKFQFLDQLKYQ